MKELLGLPPLKHDADTMVYHFVVERGQEEITRLRYRYAYGLLTYLTLSNLFLYLCSLICLLRIRGQGPSDAKVVFSVSTSGYVLSS